jgi:DNA mismatch repair protein MutL
MSDIIKLLPDSVANQIAAGEVVQRPASAVKELLENAIDAGATQISVIIKDAGRTLIQVLDNGKGMSETDARMCFERHATSKISNANDLFKLTTKGFRGEALASIAAIAQVEMKTKLHSATIGTLIEIDDSIVRKQEACQTANGTSIAVKNLFFNVPARRNFLKEDSTELKHIIEEFERVVIAHPEIGFKLISNTNEIFNLNATNLFQRILGVFGNNNKEKYVGLDENTPAVKITGYVGKPDAAKKRGADQYFFVNNRYFKHPYLNHAVTKAYDGLITDDQRPSYFIFLQVPTDKIDVNVHPTKTEIKFEEDKVIYALLHSAVKRALGKNNLGPSLDFNIETSFEITAPEDKIYYTPTIKVDSSFNPFKTNGGHANHNGGGNYATKPQPIEASNWASLYEIYKDAPEKLHEQSFQKESIKPIITENTIVIEDLVQVNDRYILQKTNHGLLFVEQQRAHEKILFEHYKQIVQHENSSSQRILFPISLELSAKDFMLMIELQANFKKLGFEIEQLGGNTIAINAVPADLTEYDPKHIIEGTLENYKLNTLETEGNKHESLAYSLAKESAIKVGRKLTKEEMGQILQELFRLEENKYTATGKTIYFIMHHDEIEVNFKKR